VFPFDIAAMTVAQCLLHQTLTSQCAQNKDRQYTPVNAAVGKKFANEIELILYSVAGKETLCKQN
jgi:hypothetical protein